MKIFKNFFICLVTCTYSVSFNNSSKTENVTSKNEKNLSFNQDGNTLPYGENYEKLNSQLNFLNNRVLYINEKEIKTINESQSLSLIKDRVDAFVTFIKGVDDGNSLVKAFENFNYLIESVKINYSLIEDNENVKRILKNTLIDINAHFRDKLFKKKNLSSHCDLFGIRIHSIFSSNLSTESDIKITYIPWTKKECGSGNEINYFLKNGNKNQSFIDQSSFKNGPYLREHIYKFFKNLKSFPDFPILSQDLSQEVIDDLSIGKSQVDRKHGFATFLTDVFDHLWLLMKAPKYNELILIPLDATDHVVYEVSDGSNFWLTNIKEINKKHYSVLDKKCKTPDFKYKIIKEGHYYSQIFNQNEPVGGNILEKEIKSDISYRFINLESYKQIVLSDFKESTFVFFISLAGCFSAIMFSLFVLNWSNECVRCGHPALKFISGMGNWVLGLLLGQTITNIFIIKNMSRINEVDARYTHKRDKNKLFLDLYYRRKFDVSNMDTMFLIILSCLASVLFSFWPLVWFAVTEYFNKNLSNVTSFFAGLSCIFGGVFTLSIFKFYYIFKKFPFLSIENSLV